MKIHLEVHLNIEDNRILQRGTFEVNNREYKEDQEFTAGVVAFQWIERIKRETGNRVTEIELVKLNGTDNITETVKKIRPILNDNELPF